MTIPNTDTDQVGYLVTTEFGISPLGQYQVKNLAPWVWGSQTRSYAGLDAGLSSVTVVEPDESAAPVVEEAPAPVVEEAPAESPVVSPDPVVEADDNTEA